MLEKCKEALPYSKAKRMVSAVFVVMTYISITLCGVMLAYNATLRSNFGQWFR